MLRHGDGEPAATSGGIDAQEERLGDRQPYALHFLASEPADVALGAFRIRADHRLQIRETQDTRVRGRKQGFEVSRISPLVALAVEQRGGSERRFEHADLSSQRSCTRAQPRKRMQSARGYDCL